MVSTSFRPRHGVDVEADLLDDLLLLDQERADDAVLDAVGAAGSTVGTLDGLGGLRDLGILAGAEGGDLYIKRPSISKGCFMNQSPQPQAIPECGGRTHARQLDATVTALHGSTLLLDVEVPKLSTGRLHNADLVGPGVVPAIDPQSALMLLLSLVCSSSFARGIAYGFLRLYKHRHTSAPNSLSPISYSSILEKCLRR